MTVGNFIAVRYSKGKATINACYVFFFVAM